MRQARAGRINTVSSLNGIVGHPFNDVKGCPGQAQELIDLRGSQGSGRERTPAKLRSYERGFDDASADGASRTREYMN